MKTKAKKWLKIALFALLIPLIAMQFISGWNWKLHDFVFMFSFIFCIGMAYEFVVSGVNNKKYRFLLGVLFLLGAFTIWGILATG
ncbi:hypothetical protein A3C57_01030 [Candidatus Nomurabacteria bacterium RIFCSPHIGHO2_02_FULL_33_12]|uniref:Uncharacterized protein n=1 Tax=Candidatus Nomurabacteria bacterium RIFCSPLOWO2_01_FULL_33_17 TaxID=1801764 RepID=A0A1F6WQL0_9BACT|nr:MAG: hypothetical protein A3C57_01030 [Candidatus Nomurabacteria bacterium RIFCSPHIGHO2_02_FULL_33_12]OGI84202.1 MAG: hypothetical protein A2903_00630 [Candidatus Nomurabacteria bacterium RIFCSPLOWO2_01_FULL_33_17]